MVKWKEVLKPKRFGGLGVVNMKVMNLTLPYEGFYITYNGVDWLSLNTIMGKLLEK